MKADYTRALVTGGAGFVGSHIVTRLLERGLEVSVIDDLSTGNLENIKVHFGKSGFLFVQGDIRDSKILKEVIEDVEVVFHHAAFVGAPQSMEKPILTNDVNVAGTLNLLDISLKSRVKRFIFASSAAIYGEQDVVPIIEDATPHPSSPYAVSKLSAELYAEAYHRIYGFETICLRYFNVYGPGQAYGPYAAVIAAFFESLAKNKSPVIYGDGEQTRDFVNVDDVVAANMLAMEKECCGEVFNVATGSSVTINDLYKTLRTIMKKEQIEPIYAEQRSADLRRSCGNINRAIRILGFRPRFTIKAGLQALNEYFKLPDYRP